jgi:hypothetical protein
MPTIALGGQTPYELVNNKRPNLADLLEWGETTFIHTAPEGGKLGPKAKEA